MAQETQREVVRRLRTGSVRAVGVVGMLGEGFDLPAIRLVAYHDKHRSVPATVQLIGRLARVDPGFPQRSRLITVADADVYPELKGVLADLYDEDADWAVVLPGILDQDIEAAQQDRAFIDALPESTAEVEPAHLHPQSARSCTRCRLIGSRDISARSRRSSGRGRVSPVAASSTRA